MAEKGVFAVGGHFKSIFLAKRKRIFVIRLAIGFRWSPAIDVFGYKIGVTSITTIHNQKLVPTNSSNQVIFGFFKPTGFVS